MGLICQYLACKTAYLTHWIINLLVQLVRWVLLQTTDLQLTVSCLVFNKTSHRLQQTCSRKRVWRMCDPLADTRHWTVKTLPESLEFAIVKKIPTRYHLNGNTFPVQELRSEKRWVANDLEYKTTLRLASMNKCYDCLCHHTCNLKYFALGTLEWWSEIFKTVQSEA